jgi:hypothetical protein
MLNYLVPVPKLYILSDFWVKLLCGGRLKILTETYLTVGNITMPPLQTKLPHRPYLATPHP